MTAPNSQPTRPNQRTRQAHRAPADLQDPAAGFSLHGWERLGEHHFEVRGAYRHGAQPLAVVHAVRQSALLLAHEAYGVPRGHHCVFRSLTCTTPAGADARPAAGTEVALRLSCPDPDLRRGQLVGARFRGEAVDGGPAFGRAEVDFAFLSPAVYRFVRGSGEEAADEGGEADAGGFELRPTVEQLTFRGAAVDHIPGMVLAQAALDAATGEAATGGRPVGLTAVFTGYTAPDAPCRFHTRPAAAPAADARYGAPRGATEVWAVQSGRRVFEGTVHTA
ncbi:hypothetical protein MUU72_17950 [Streptomyces sp. RS10V-4]|uniref:AfsA-related hotdog domain-containing protein n=1 Tax=Streptomyces rhizoryzae TaxID=2932493 RepID=UPI002005877E|nr:AfsA-related hotdog domain-containing protein [Streptomyces rhizoryzae]MCK7624967.1 hypothetical protein [Streptomyces rhizoryzae]